MNKFRIIPKKINHAMLFFAAFLLLASSSCKKNASAEEDKTERGDKMEITSSEAKAAGVSAGLSFTVVSNTMIRETAPWNGFTDLHGYAGKLYCVYREGATHVSQDGKIRVIRYNTTTFQWDGIKLLSYIPPAPYTAGDLRDPKLSTTPDNKLMMTVAATIWQGTTKVGTQSMTYFSTDGVNWGAPSVLGAPGSGWLWRTEWYDGTAYNFKYGSNGISLMTSTTGTSFTTQLGPVHLANGQYPNETGLVFNPGAGGDMVALARHDGTTDKNARVGFSSPPYTSISWYNSGIRIGGPDLFRMENGGIIAGIRRYNGSSQYPAIYLVHSATPGTMTELVRLVSGNAGDCGYTGIWKFGSQIWVSYYSSHTGKACIYLAKLNYTL